MRRAVLLTVAALLATAAPAAAQSPIDDFRDDGSINPCAYSPGTLKETAENLPPDVLQYSPGLADQLAAGQEGCAGGAPGTPNDPRQFEEVTTPAGSPGVGGPGGGGAAGAPGGASTIPDPPAPAAIERARLADIATPPVSAATGSDVPGWATALMVALGALAVLFVLGRFGGLSGERLTAPLRASFGEAGGRSADALAEVWDRVRLGR